MSGTAERLVLLSDTEREALREGAQALDDKAKRINPDWSSELAERREELFRYRDRLQLLARAGL